MGNNRSLITTCCSVDRGTSENDADFAGFFPPGTNGNFSFSLCSQMRRALGLGPEKIEVVASQAMTCTGLLRQVRSAMLTDGAFAAFTIARAEAEGPDGRPRSVLAVWKGEKVNKMVVDGSRKDADFDYDGVDELALPFAKKVGRMYLMGCVDVQKLNLTSLIYCDLGSLHLLAAGSYSEEGGSKMNLFLAMTSRDEKTGLDISLANICSFPVSKFEVRKASFCPSLHLLVAGDSAGMVRVWALTSAMDEDEKGSQMRKKQDTTFESRVESNLKGKLLVEHQLSTDSPVISIDVRLAPFSNNEDSLFESEDIEYDILIVQENGMLCILRGSMEPNKKAQVISTCSLDPEGKFSKFAQVALPIEQVHAHHAQSRASMPNRKHAFVLAIISGKLKDSISDSSVLIWDLRSNKPRKSTKEIILEGEQNSITALGFGPHMNGPLILGLKNGLVKVLNIGSGQEIRKHSDLLGSTVQSILLEPNQAMWCISKDGRVLTL